MDKNEILLIKGKEYKEMTKKLLYEADMVSDIPKGSRTIGIKPNLVTPTPASYGATTHPEIVAGIVEYLQENGSFEIVIAEGSWVGDKTKEAFEYCGYNALAESYGVRLLDTQKDGEYICSNNDIPIHVNNCVKSFDYIINVPVLKGHCQTKITCALKNMKGLIPNSEKRRFHTLGLHKPIAYLNTCIRQDFIVVDHICGDLDFEEGGNPVERNIIMAGKDPVLIDSYVCKLLGYEIEDVPYVKICSELGVGCGDPGMLKLRPVDDDTYPIPEDYLINSGAQTALHSEQRVLDVNYAVDEIDSCSACYASLVPALLRLKDEGLLEKLDTKIAIGQGHQGETGVLGVGKCTAAFAHSVPGCPPSEEDIYKYLKEYINSSLI